MKASKEDATASLLDKNYHGPQSQPVSIRVQSSLMNDVDALKHHPSGGARFAYKLKNANVYVSPLGFHFTDHLDPVEEISPEIDASQLTTDESSYIETQLQANRNKFTRGKYPTFLNAMYSSHFIGQVFFKIFKIQNKMLVIGRKTL